MGYINPLLNLPAGNALLKLPRKSRQAIELVMRELREQANTEAEKSWSKRKGPMAAYWRAVSTYARHIAHALSHQPHELEHGNEGVVIPLGLRERCLEIFRWNKSGKVGGEALAQFAERNNLDPDDPIRAAERATIRELLALVLEAPAVPEYQAMVVMEFNEEEVPEFTQGYNADKLLTPVTAERCQWLVSEVVRLNAIFKESTEKYKGDKGEDK